MNGRLVWALISKDLTLFFRNRFFALVTALGLFAWIGIYFVLPRSVDETIEMGLYASAVPPIFEQFETGEEGLVIERVDSEEALKAAVLDGEYLAGIVLPEGMVAELLAGKKPQIDVYFGAETSEEMKEAIVVLLRQFTFVQSGQGMDVEVRSQVLGRDMAGVQIAPRDRMVPFFAILLLLTETLGLASLISEEIEGHTIQALLATPLTIGGVFLAKASTGVLLAFGQATVLLAAVGGLGQQAPLILVSLFLGAVLVTGIGFLLAALGRDMMSVMGWGILAVLILSVPAFGVMFPGTVSSWAKFIPSYYLLETIHQAGSLGAGWVDLWPNLLMLLGFDLVFVALGILALRRRFQ